MIEGNRIELIPEAAMVAAKSSEVISKLKYLRLQTGNDRFQLRDSVILLGNLDSKGFRLASGKWIGIIRRCILIITAGTVPACTCSLGSSICSQS